MFRRFRVGGEALRQAFLIPSQAAAEMLALQTAHQLDGADAGLYRGILDAADLDGVEDYITGGCCTLP